MRKQESPRKANPQILEFRDPFSPTFFDLNGEIHINEEVYQAVASNIENTFGSASRVPVVAFLGDTQSGKSTLIKYLMKQNDEKSIESDLQFSPEIEQSEDLPRVAERRQIEPTTANMQVFLGTDRIFLDMEGEAGGNPPKNDPIWELDEATRLKYKSMRRTAVKKHFPRLAYAVADVIVFMSTLKISNHRLKEAVEIFAEYSLRGQRSRKPSLVIVCNFQEDLDDFQDDEEQFERIMSEQFWSSHDYHRSLLKKYSEVKFFSLP
jgi:hypothetical protein